MGDATPISRGEVLNLLAHVGASITNLSKAIEAVRRRDASAATEYQEAVISDLTGLIASMRMIDPTLAVLDEESDGR